MFKIITKFILLFSVIIPVVYMMHSSTKEKIFELKKENPFNYDLGIEIVKCQKPGNDITICCHGYGSNNLIAQVINYYNIFSGYIIGFNFPDYNINEEVDHNQAAYGTPKEVLPLIYILKRCICDLKLEHINLYGFSAGGGAIINALSLLVNSKYDDLLKELNISSENKKEILHVLKNGAILLDCPLKSIEEIIAFRSASKELIALEKHYRGNNMEPINSLNRLNGIDLNIFLHLENPDEILYNRDDKLFIDRLMKVNQGKNIVSITRDGGHLGYHKALWENYIKSK